MAHQASTIRPPETKSTLQKEESPCIQQNVSLVHCRGLGLRVELPEANLNLCKPQPLNVVVALYAWEQITV